MSCCGNQRASFRRGPDVSSQSAIQYWNPGATDFQYSGNGQLTVTGPLTGTIYRFAGGAASVRVHASDAPSLAAVPGLRPVR
jgi:hypothetical protein